MDSLFGASAGALGSMNAVWGVYGATPGLESKLIGKSQSNQTDIEVESYHLSKMISSVDIPLRYFH